MIWRLPRGFILAENVVGPFRGSKHVVASYAEYDGTWQGATHFHPSYQYYWLDGRDRVLTQCKKLRVPFADCGMARDALEFVKAIGIGEAVVRGDGQFEGDYLTEAFSTGQAEVVAGDI